MPRSPVELVAKVVETVPQTSNCEECWEWADAVAEELCMEWYEEACDCDEYDDACYADCAETRAGDASLQVTEKIYYEIAAEVKPECLLCLQSWEADC